MQSRMECACYDLHRTFAMYEEVGNAEQSSFYSDLTLAGGLGAAIQAQLKAIGSSLTVKKPDPDVQALLPFDWEVVQQNQRFSQINIAKHERFFMLDFWDRGVYLAHGSTPLLPIIAQVIHAWIVEEVSTAELRQRFPSSA